MLGMRHPLFSLVDDARKFKIKLTVQPRIELKVINLSRHDGWRGGIERV
jgi:hypothetical protein